MPESLDTKEGALKGFPLIRAGVLDHLISIAIPFLLAFIGKLLKSK